MLNRILLRVLSAFSIVIALVILLFMVIIDSANRGTYLLALVSIILVPLGIYFYNLSKGDSDKKISPENPEIKELKKELKSRNQSTLINVIKVIGDLGYTQLGNDIVPFIWHKNDEIQEQCHNSLIKLKSKELLPTLVKKLYSNSLEISSETRIVKVFRQWSYPETTDVLIYLLETNKNTDLSTECLDALLDIDTTKACSAIADATKSTDAKIREHAFWTLLERLDKVQHPRPFGGFPTDRSVLLFAPLCFPIGLADKVDDVRIAAVYGLGQLDPKQHLGSLVKALEDTNPIVIGKAIECLGESEDKRIVPLLKKFSSDERKHTQDGDTLAEATEEAIEKILAKSN